MERRDPGEDALAVALRRQALLEERIATYRASGWLVLAASLFLLEITLSDNGNRLPVPVAVYAACALAGCVHLASPSRSCTGA